MLCGGCALHASPLYSPKCPICTCVGPQPVAPVKPPVVAEWGSGVTPRLDPDTISKHVKQMVDVSMRVLFHFLIGRPKQNNQASGELQVTICISLCCPLQSIMKNYDQNQDGYISLEDFEKIAANFPFSFRTHETDRLGNHNSHKGLLQGCVCKSLTVLKAFYFFYFV